jgi:hypothetical protein
MKTLPAIIAFLLLSQPASARFGQSSLAEVFAKSDRVVEVVITSARVIPLRAGLENEACGYLYQAKVAETFKGSRATSVRFASNEQMAPDSRHLLFLRSYDGDFPSDVSISYVDPATNANIDSRAGCAEVLPRLKSNWLHTAEFLQNDLVKLSYWIAAPPQLPAVTARIEEAATNGTIVEWRVLRAWLQQRKAQQPGK